jgi:hypothetical protein
MSADEAWWQVILRRPRARRARPDPTRRQQVGPVNTEHKPLQFVSKAKKIDRPLFPVNAL